MSADCMHIQVEIQAHNTQKNSNGWDINNRDSGKAK